MYLRTEFLERVAHELRGPAGVTSGALDELELALGPEAEKFKALFLMARRGVRRVLRSADRLQRTAQLEGGKTDWSRVSTDLRGIVETATREAEHLEGRRAICVEVTCTESPCFAAIDAGWMHNAIAETVGNAIRFARTTVTVDTQATELEVKITVRDDGPGFSGPPLLRFQPPSAKRGLGLSLPIVRDVVSSHGGRMEIDDREEAPPSGARVIITLPLDPSR